MVEEILIMPNMTSIVGDPRIIREYIKPYGEEKFAIFGLPGVIIADIIDNKIAEIVLQNPPKDVITYQTPIGTLYCAGIRNSDYAITDDLRISKLDGNFKRDDIFSAINDIGSKKEYFAGSSITGMPGGVFATIAHYYSNLLTDEELNNYADIFKIVDSEVNLSEKGEYMLELLKETWDYTPRSIRSLCKIDVKTYISTLLKQNKDVSLKKLEDYLRIKRATPNKAKIDLAKDCHALARLLEYGLSNKYMKSHLPLNFLIGKLKSFDSSKDLNELLKIILERLPEEFTIMRYTGRSPKVQDAALQKLILDAKVRPKIGKRLVYHAFEGWKNSLIDRIEDLKNKASQVNRYKTIYSNILIKQLELLEKGEYIQIKIDSDNLSELTDEPNNDIKIFRGQNFKNLEYVGIFCPMGLSQKWDSWKIQQGPIVRLAKYCKNVVGDLFRVEIDSLGAFKIEGSGDTVFDDATKDQLSLIEDLINYGLPDKERKALGWDTLSIYDDYPLDKKASLSKIRKKEDPKPQQYLTKGDERLLRKIRH